MYSTPRVPIGGHTRKLIDGETLPADDFEAARYLFERVREHMDYDKSRLATGQGMLSARVTVGSETAPTFTASFCHWHGPKKFQDDSKLASRFQRTNRQVFYSVTTAGPGSTRTDQGGSQSISPKQTGTLSGWESSSDNWMRIASCFREAAI